MKNINKFKKQKNNMKTLILFIMFFAMTICLSIMINASMYDRLTALKGKNCNLVERDSISSSIKTALINKFVLTGGGNCYFVLDYPPFHPDTLNLLWFDYTDYSEIDYVIEKSIYIDENDKEYLFILGKDSSALDKIANFTANYDTKYQYYLKTYDADYFSTDNFVAIPEDFWVKYDPSYTGPKDQGCVDNAIENIYLGNQGSYQKNGAVQFSSSCIDANTISYGFCFAKEFINPIYFCNCVNGKCIATPNEILHYLNLKGNYAGPLGRIIDNNLINSAVSSWVRNY